MQGKKTVGTKKTESILSNTHTLCFILSLYVIYSSPGGHNNNLQPRGQMETESYVSLASEDLSFNLCLFKV